MFPSPKPVSTTASDLGAAIAVLVAEEPDVGRGRHEHATETGQHAVGKGQPVGEDRGTLVDAVAVAVFEPADPSGGRGDGIVDHLGDVEETLFVPGDRDRAGHLGLGGDQLDRQVFRARRKAERSASGGCGRRGCSKPWHCEVRQSRWQRIRGRTKGLRAMMTSRLTGAGSWNLGDESASARPVGRVIPEQRQRHPPEERNQAGQEGDLGVGACPIDPAADRLCASAVEVQVRKLSTPVILPICRTESSWVNA